MAAVGVFQELADDPLRVAEAVPAVEAAAEKAGVVAEAVEEVGVA